MAADSAQKRLSAICMGSPWRGVGAYPAAPSVQQRSAGVYLYALAAIPTSILSASITLDAETAHSVTVGTETAATITADAETAHALTFEIDPADR